MDSHKFLNRYINSLGEQVKSLTMEKTMLTTQLAMAQEEIEELKKQLSHPKPEENNGQWQS
jgi:chromosome segregation ATPase